MKYCSKCIIPETRPDQFLDKDGVCNACKSYEQRKEIDWDKRLNHYEKNINKNKNKNNSSKWDCVIPSSGGKDSTYQAIRARELDLNKKKEWKLKIQLKVLNCLLKIVAFLMSNL
jgi:hypothetical protein